jgi:glycosyltransferase involved in cell wall biosynthesis
MRVVFISPTFTPQMSGYAGMALPKAMAKLGIEVHVIAGNLNVYYHLPEYKEVYEPFIGPAITNCGDEILEGYTLHRLQHFSLFRQIRLKGMVRKLRKIKPDIVHTWTNISLIALESAVWSKILGYKLFTAQHNSISTFILASQNKIRLIDKIINFSLRFSQGRFISLFTEKCYPPTPDCLEIAVRFMGVQRQKCSLRSLGVDTEVFHPVRNRKEETQRRILRKHFGFSQDDIVCIYTGRLTYSKNPLCLAQAISNLLSVGRPFKGLFIGNGSQEAQIKSYEGCLVHPFVKYLDLTKYYQLADVAVYPVEYTTSMLEAAACGLPLVISNRIQAKERIEGNGLTYAENDLQDLIHTLKKLENIDERSRLGLAGNQKMRQNFSWLAVASKTLNDFQKSFQK